jgi:hypothetical protein
VKRAFPPSQSHSSHYSRVFRAFSAVGIVAAGLALSTVASSQGKAKPGAAKASASTPAPPPPPVGAIPAGASITNEKGPGLPIVLVCKPNCPPTVLLGGAPVAAASTAAPVSTATPAVGTEQEEALKQLESEAKLYKTGASGYAKAVGQIIKQRYEQKRKARLSSLQDNIDKDAVELRKARMDTMERLKAFLAKYPDQAEHTPNAMFRLAALYEENAVENDVDPGDPNYTEKLRAAYGPAEDLYRDIIKKFPTYSQRPAVQFFLGALLSDTGRGPESQYVWRALVCSNHYQYPAPPPTNPAEQKAQEKWKDGIPPMPQDHDGPFWDKWRDTHYTIPDPKKKAKAPPKGKAAPAVSTATEDSYVEVYPEDCQPLGGMTTSTGEEPRFLAQTWWRIGEYHYSRGDEIAEEEGYFGASPYRYGRAKSAYDHSIKTTNETVKVFAMYKIAWTLFKQQRYNAAREQFIAMLAYFDEKSKKGGDAGDQQMRQDAYDYIAASLTYLDMEGPGPNDPYIERDDIFGLFSGKVLEQKLEISIDRVQDPKLVPQDKPWTPRIYKALAAEFESDEVQHDAIKTYELVIKKWECDPEAPQFQNKIAQLYDMLALKAESQAEKDDYSGKALEARTKLLNYVGKDSKWVECNKNNPDAIRSAEALMNEGVKNAAGRHTALGRVYISKAKNYPDGSKESKDNLEKARNEYKLADKGWAAYLAQDPDAADAYESRYWIADSRHKTVLTTRLMGEPLNPKSVEDAREAAVAVRDSNLDDKYLRYAAYFAVDVYDMLADEGFDAYKKSGCSPSSGLEVIESPLDEPGDSCRPDSEKEARENKRLWLRDIPSTVLRTLKERDEYASKVPESVDVDKNAVKYKYQVADALYRYGRFEEATPRYEAIWHERCGKDDQGFEAWYRLGVMSNLKGDSVRSLALVDEAKKKSCAMNEEQKLREKNFSEPTELEALYLQADKAYNEAEKETDPKLKASKYREAAAKYELALKRAPARKEAPRGAMNSALCYKQVNEYKRAAEVYRFFLDKYGKEEDLIAYRDGDAKKGIKKNPEEFKTRLDYTKRALGELGRTYLQAFDYAAAAKHYDEVSNRTLLDAGERRDAAGNAVILQANLGNREKMLSARTRYFAMGPSAADKAEVDFTVAEFEYKQWKQSPNDAGQRGRAATALDQYYTTYKAQGPAAKFVVDAAYDLATLRKSTGEQTFRDWYKKTSDAFAVYKAGNKDAVGSRESDFGAEGAYFFVNERIEKEWDTPPGQPPKVKYEGAADKVTKQLTEDEKKREKYVDDLDQINKTYVSPKWFPVVLARQGSVYDTHRSALAKASVNVLSAKDQAFVDSVEKKAQKTLDDPGSSDEAKQKATELLEKVDKIRSNTASAWTDLRKKHYAVIEPAMIDRYCRAYLRGKQFDVKDPMVTRAVQRLAYYTDQLEDTKMRQYLVGVEKDMGGAPFNFKYRDQMFKQARPGSIVSPLPSTDIPLAAGVSKSE